jgi:hypothetical protein
MTSKFRFSRISIFISLSKSEFRFWVWFRLFTFDDIENPTNFILISSKFWFRFRFRHRNYDSDFVFGVPFSVPDFNIHVEISKHFSLKYCKSTFLFWLLNGISIPTVGIKIKTPITFDNFDQKFRWKSKLISIGIPIEIPTKLILVDVDIQEQYDVVVTPALPIYLGPRASRSADQ